ncbi:hypothetical protein BDR26DRAFT_930011 [Obelidium mucronatum]|nr:hypothetical protein BDR26DRAFT_930011 [Obelidium mucronatum]
MPTTDTEAIPLEPHTEDFLAASATNESKGLNEAESQDSLLEIFEVSEAVDPTTEVRVPLTLQAVVEEFGCQELIAWIGSAYLLTAAPMGLVYGKFAGESPVETSNCIHRHGGATSP